MPETVQRRARRGRCGISSCCNAPKSMEIGEIIQKKACLNAAVKKPYEEDLPGPLVPGTYINIQGFVKPDCSRFSVNLTCGKADNSDIAVHINPRLSLRYVVRNTRIRGKWGDEETTSPRKFDLARGKPFEMSICVTENVFYISINGKHHSAFVFRIPIEDVKVLLIDGSVEIQGVKYTKIQSYPPRKPEELFVVPTGDERIAPQSLESPVTATLPEGFQQDWQLEIYGRVKILPSTFYINLQKGTNLWPHPIIYLHLNARFNSSFGNHLFIRNAWMEGGWGQEERSGGAQFTPGAPFVLVIRRLYDHFSVWVDGKLAGEFRFRGPIDVVDAVRVQGDMVLRCVYMRKRKDDRCFSRSTLNLLGFEKN